MVTAFERWVDAKRSIDFSLPSIAGAVASARAAIAGRCGQQAAWNTAACYDEDGSIIAKLEVEHQVRLVIVGGVYFRVTEEKALAWQHCPGTLKQAERTACWLAGMRSSTFWIKVWEESQT